MAKSPTPLITHPKNTIVHIAFIALVLVIGGAILWKTFSPKSSTVSDVKPSPAKIEALSTPAHVTPSPSEIDLDQEGFSNILKDILENKPKESMKASDTETILTKDGTYTFQTPKGFTQSVDEKSHTVGYYLSRTSGEPNDQVVLMLVQPATIGIKDTGLYVLTTAFKREIFKDLLKLGTSYVLLEKTTVEPWNRFTRGMYTYSFESRLPKGAYKAQDMLIYKNDTSTDGLWIHIQMPAQAWETILPKFLQSLETLKIQ